jgi:hypothetical protein
MPGYIREEGSRFMKIRKQVYELTVKDLEEFPVWEHCMDEECEEDQDEATVRPYEFTPPFELGGSMMVMKADFTLADGTKMAGYFFTNSVLDMPSHRRVTSFITSLLLSAFYL